MTKSLYLGVPFNSGQPHVGTAKAPQLFREVNKDMFSFHNWTDLGLVHTPSYGGREAAIEHAFALSEFIKNLKIKNSFLSIVGGDHGQALGTLHGLLTHYPQLIVVWIDAHADANTPTSSPSGNMHGMPLSWLMGSKDGAPWWIEKTLKPKNLLYIGVRDMDPYEKMLIEELDIPFISPAEAMGPGLEHLIKKQLTKMDPTGKVPVHISFDVDALDSESIECTGTRVSGGLDRECVETIFKTLKAERKIVSTEIVEINPDLGQLSEARDLCRWSKELLEIVRPQKENPWLYAARKIDEKIFHRPRAF